MMSHEEDGRLMAYLDGELPAEDTRAVESHLGSCAACAASAARLRSERTRLSAALVHADVGAGAAARRVRERLGQQHPAVAPSGFPMRTAHPARRPSWIRRSRALQAALFVLFVAGGASAVMPGSPLRRWLDRGGPPTAPTSSPTATLQAPAEAAPPPAQGSITGLPAAGELRVTLELPPGTELTVVFVDGERGTIHANPDTNFLSADGLIGGTVHSGPVRVELPRAAAVVSLEVGGQPYLEMQNGQVTFRAPPVDSTNATFTFRIR